MPNGNRYLLKKKILGRKGSDGRQKAQVGGGTTGLLIPHTKYDYIAWFHTGYAQQIETLKRFQRSASTSERESILFKFSCWNVLYMTLNNVFLNVYLFVYTNYSNNLTQTSFIKRNQRGQVQMIIGPTFVNGTANAAEVQPNNGIADALLLPSKLHFH